LQTDHQECAIGHLAREFDHAGAGGEQIHWRRRCAAIPEPGADAFERIIRPRLAASR
jgi:hypothetical protein